MGGAEPRRGCVQAKGRCGVAAHLVCARQNLFGFLQALALPAHLLWQTLERRHGLGPQTAGRFGEEAVEVEKLNFYGTSSSATIGRLLRRTLVRSTSNWDNI